MSDDDHKAPIERAVELVVYAPIGLAMFARDFVPPLLNQFVARGKAQLDELQKKVENQMGQARIVGQFAVAQGQEQLKREVTNRFARPEAHEQAPEAEEPEAEQQAPDADQGHGIEAGALDAEPSGNGSTPRRDPSALPIPDYDELSASQVVARLAGLSADELEAVRAYEEDQRRRKTILTRIEQLTA